MTIHSARIPPWQGPTSFSQAGYTVQISVCHLADCLFTIYNASYLEKFFDCSVKAFSIVTGQLAPAKGTNFPSMYRLTSFPYSLWAGHTSFRSHHIMKICAAFASLQSLCCCRHRTHKTEVQVPGGNTGMYIVFCDSVPPWWTGTCLALGIRQGLQFLTIIRWYQPKTKAYFAKFPFPHWMGE